MDLAVVVGAFAFGFVAAQVRLPPLVGYLVAGFVLHAFGFETTEAIEEIADLGLLLLLFGIGLKLRPRSLLRPTVWATTLVVAAGTLAVVTTTLVVLARTGLPLVGGMGLREAVLVGFALSFSSTVFAVKSLEDQGEMASLAGTVAIGVLIVQDLLAVGFLSVNGGTVPSPWAPLMVAAIVLARPVYAWVLDRTGHGELQLLLGFTLVVAVGAGGFGLVGLKDDLGALLVGALLTHHPRAKELADRLLGLKDLLLVGFFLSIGLGGTPTPAAMIVAIVAITLLPAKTAAYVWVLTRLRLRARTSLHTALTLSNYSEFGLIVAAAAVAEAQLDGEWLTAVAVAVSLSFATSAPLTTWRYGIYERLSGRLAGLEQDDLRAEDSIIAPDPADVLVFGLGRVGTGAYDELVERRGPRVLGIERSDTRVQRHTAEGRRAIRGDALDPEFWDRVRLVHVDPDVVVLAMGDHSANLEAVRRVRTNLPRARIAAVARWPDEIAELEAAGVHVARNLFGEAGQGLADDVDSLPT